MRYRRTQLGIHQWSTPTCRSRVPNRLRAFFIVLFGGWSELRACIRCGKFLSPFEESYLLEGRQFLCCSHVHTWEGPWV